MSKTILTKEGFVKMKQRLAEKIEQLRSLREEKAHAYTASGDGWHDNPGWTQLGQQEELLATEVALLQQKLSNAYLVNSENMDKSKVGLGCTVEFMLFKQDTHVKAHRLTIAGSGESDLKQQKITLESPLGRALNYMRVNEEKFVDLPSGKVRIKITNLTYE
jgi:transcription elongation factor GreA